MKKILVILFLCLAFSNCEKPKSQIEIEKEIFAEIFSDVIDSIYMDRRLFLHFPPFPKRVYDKKGNFIKEDTTGLSLEFKKHKLEEEQIKSDTIDTKIAIDDVLTPIKERQYINFKKVFKGVSLNITDTIQKIKLDLNLLKHNKPEKIISIKELPKIDVSDIFLKNKSLKLTGIYSFSRIIFDKNYNYGVLEAGYYCGGKCGQGFLIYIKKVENKWIVFKVEPTWIA
jgi:predicted transport protein